MAKAEALRELFAVSASYPMSPGQRASMDTRELLRLLSSSTAALAAFLARYDFGEDEDTAVEELATAVASASKRFLQGEVINHAELDALGTSFLRAVCSIHDSLILTVEE